MRNKPKDLLALKKYRKEWGEKVWESTYVPQETEIEQKNRIQHLKKSYNDFVKYYFPHYATSDCGKFQISAANKIKNNPHAKYVMMWSRSHAKSTHFTIFIPLWLKIQPVNSLKVMVLVSHNETNAKILISDTQSELESNQRYINDFGSQIKYGSWEEGKFVTEDEKAFFIRGLGQSPRGLRYKQYRPNYIVTDDLDTDILSRNPSRVEVAYQWTVEALYNTIDMGEGRFIAVGNLISKNSVLKKLSANPEFKTIKVNATDKNGNPSWPEKYTKSKIQKVISTIGYRASQKEYYNNPLLGDGVIFKPEWVNFIPPLKTHQYDRLIAYCDPSFKNTRTSDYKAVMVVGKKNTEMHILKAFVRKCSINELVRWFYDFHTSLKTAVCEYYMEANFIQDLLVDEFEKEGELRGYQLPLRKDKRKKPDKFARIESLTPLFERGFVKISEKEKKGTDMEQFIEQLLCFEKGSSTHDDAPDALEGAIHILASDSRKKNLPYVIKKRTSRTY